MHVDQIQVNIEIRHTAIEANRRHHRPVHSFFLYLLSFSVVNVHSGCGPLIGSDMLECHEADMQTSKGRVRLVDGIAWPRAMCAGSAQHSP